MKPQRPDAGHAIDWNEAKRRLARAAEATEAAEHLSPERAKAVLDERARALARVPPAPPRAGEVLEIVTFALGPERYALETRFVREVVRLTDYARLPGASPFLAGVLNLRGEIVALMDLRAFFDLPAGATESSRVLVIGDGRAEFGVAVDAASEVAALRLDEVHVPPEGAAGTGRECIRGVTADALILLDGAELLRDGRLFIDQGEEAGA